MGVFTNFNITPEKSDHDSLRINARKRKIEAKLGALKYIDNDTKQAIIYIPSIELSGYGENFEKATEIVKFSINDFFKHLVDLSSRELSTELSRLGWEKQLFNKQFARPYTAVQEDAENLNAENNKIERITLTAA